MAESSLEQQKLSFEKEKLALEDKWRRNTYVWSIASAFLTAAVTITVALIAVEGKTSKQPGVEIASGPVEACRDSLRRLDSLAAAVPNQTVAELREAIRRHTNQCDDVLVGILAELHK